MEYKLNNLDSYRQLYTIKYGWLQLLPTYILSNSKKIHGKEIHDVNIKPEYQGKGYGTELLKDVIQNIDSNFFTIAPEKGLDSFYTHIGFKKVQKIQNMGITILIKIKNPALQNLELRTNELGELFEINKIKTYYCFKCKQNHQYHSIIGKEHFQYAQHQY